MKRVRGRFMLLGAAVVLSVAFVVPSVTPLYDVLPGWVKKVLPKEGIALGLDLQGGIHLVLEVDEDRAVEIVIDRAVNAIQDQLVDQKIPVETVKRTGSRRVTLEFENAQLTSDIQKLMDENFVAFLEVEPDSTNHKLVYELHESEVKRVKDSAINQALETIRNRIDQFGVREPLIARQGPKQIVVQLPGVKDPKRAKDLIKETALLEFKLLDESSSLAQELPQRIPKGKEEAVLAEFKNRIPEGDEILFEKTVDEDSGREFRIPYLVKKRVMLAGDVLRDARVSIDEFNQ
ncbi:MAG: protein translocase subunit SecD, partial [Nitrospirales bacterium]